MARTKRLIRSFYRLLFPMVVLSLLAVTGSALWLVQKAANPPKAEYLVMPDKYGRLSTRAAKITDESWTNHDGTQSRGWLLRGSENAPAIILLHRYGTDRSWVLDLGVKINEATDFTILMPDERAHGVSPLVKKSSLGGAETEDVLAAMEFLKGMKTDDKNVTVGKDIGIYGVELGAFAGLAAAAKDQNVKALVLDSVPLTSDELLGSVIAKKFPFAHSVTTKIAELGTYPYYYNGGYRHDSLCDLAKALSNRKVMLLAGTDAPTFQDSTKELQVCFTGETIESKLDLAPSGYNINNASLEQAEQYDQRVIDFFKRSLSGIEVLPSPVIAANN